MTNTPNQAYKTELEILARSIADIAGDNDASSWPTGIVRDKIEALYLTLHNQSLQRIMDRLPKETSVNYGGTNITTTYDTERDAVQDGYNQALRAVKQILTEEMG